MAQPKRTSGTPAIVAAERAGIAFRVLEYTHDPGAESYALEAAAALGVAPEAVFKTLIAALDGNGGTKLAVAIIPANTRLNPKQLAAAAGGKRADLANPADAERATGYVLGGISPLGQRRRLPTVLDQRALAHPTVYVSAGRRGLELALAPADLARLTGAIIATITGCR